MVIVMTGVDHAGVKVSWSKYSIIWFDTEIYFTYLGLSDVKSPDILNFDVRNENWQFF